MANTIAQSAADGAIYEAIFYLSSPQPDQHWAVDGKPRELLIGHSRVTLRVEDEAWWVNPNSASPALLEALLSLTGSEPETARRQAISISEWVGSAPAPRPSNVLETDYRAAGLNYGPPGAPFETLDELGRVLGITPAVLAAIRPHLTIFGPPNPSLTSPDPVVLAAVARSIIAERAISANEPPPDINTTRIIAVASGPGNAEVTRSAVVRFGAVLPQGYQVLAWDDRF